MHLPTAGFFLSLCLVLSTMITVESQRPIQVQREELEALKAVSTGMESFSVHFLLRIIEDTNYDNLVVSPLSVWTMLTVLSEGARDETARQITKVLRHPDDGNKKTLRDAYSLLEKTFIVNTPTVEIATVNSFFSDKNFPASEDYTRIIRNQYRTNIFTLDFKKFDTADVINKHISQQTRGKINEIVQQDDLKDGNMIMTNAVYFKGKWNLPFNASLTKRETFFNTQNEPIGQVNMMYRRGPFPYMNLPNFTAHAVELPYGVENRLSMLVVVPYFKRDLKEVFQKFAVHKLNNIIKSLEEAAELNEDEEVDVYLPRFSIDSDLTLNSILFNMGIQDVFDPQWSDLSGVSTAQQLFLSRILHKAFIEVTEDGTTAGAVTAGELSNRNTPAKFVANKPFIYFIFEKKTGIIVFAGSYNKPSLY